MFLRLCSKSIRKLPSRWLELPHLPLVSFSKPVDSDSQFRSGDNIWKSSFQRGGGCRPRSRARFELVFVIVELHGTWNRSPYRNHTMVGIHVLCVCQGSKGGSCCLIPYIPGFLSKPYVGFADFRSYHIYMMQGHQMERGPASRTAERNEFQVGGC